MKKLLAIIIICLCFHLLFELFFFKESTTFIEPSGIETPVYVGNF